jgi:hypothetical protein
MSRLAMGNDDHAEAALKNLRDAQALKATARFDGTAYLSGYAVECSLKTILLFQQAVDTTTSTVGTVDIAKLNDWHMKLRNKPFGHNLVRLVSEMASTSGSKYIPDLPFAASIFSWSETLRYSPAGRVGETEARGYLNWAEKVTAIVTEMQADGVL